MPKLLKTFDQLIRSSEIRSSDHLPILHLKKKLIRTFIIRLFLVKVEPKSFCGSLEKIKPGGLDLSRRDLDRDLDLDTEKKLVSTVEKISTVSKS